MTDPKLMNSNKILLPKTYSYPKLGDNDIVIGDPHGSLEPVHRLLKSMNYNPDKQKVHFTGDMIDRGPESKEILDAMNQYGWTSNLGNHDDKILRASKGNAVKMNPELQDTINQLGPDWKNYAKKMDTWPLATPFEDSQGRGAIVHAAVHPDYPVFPLEKQPKNYLLMGRTHPFEVYNPNKPSTAPPWQESYKGNEAILHGHHVHEHHQGHGNPNVHSLDAGSVFGSNFPWGGKLRGMRLGDRSIHEVPGDPRATAHYNKLWENNERFGNE